MRHSLQRVWYIWTLLYSTTLIRCLITLAISESQWNSKQNMHISKRYVFWFKVVSNFPRVCMYNTNNLSAISRLRFSAIQRTLEMHQSLTVNIALYTKTCQINAFIILVNVFCARCPWGWNKVYTCIVSRVGAEFKHSSYDINLHTNTGMYIATLFMCL